MGAASTLPLPRSGFSGGQGDGAGLLACLVCFPEKGREAADLYLLGGRVSGAFSHRRYRAV